MRPMMLLMLRKKKNRRNSLVLIYKKSPDFSGLFYLLYNYNYLASISLKGRNGYPVYT